MSKKLLPFYVAVIVANIIWAAAGPIIKLTLEYIPVYTFLFIRFSIVCLVLLPFLYVELKKNSVHKSDYFKIILLGIFSQSSLALIFFGFKYTTALEATMIGIFGTMLTVILGHYLYEEELNIKTKIGFGIATLGTVYIALEPLLVGTQNPAAQAERFMGNAYAVIYVLAFTMYTVWSKVAMGESTKEVKKTLKFLHITPMKKKYSPTVITALTFYVGLVTFIPLALLEMTGTIGNQPFNIQAYSLTPILGILYMAIISSLVAYMSFEWGLSKVEIKDTAIFSYLQPIFTLPFAFLLLGELPTQFTIVGGTIIALGVLIAESKKS